ncbi:MAG: hypothetical protein QOE36_107 [Gaiellaceae bacterium]|jgi:uncharacterized integral membrane protein|nr:hypothetical protein [Gaiellaceae bacterium]
MGDPPPEVQRTTEPPAAVVAPHAGEGRLDKVNRQAQRARLYFFTFLAVAMIVILIALILDNNTSVPISWVFGSSHSSLIWIIVVAALVGWLLGIATSFLLRRRTRRLD